MSKRYRQLLEVERTTGVPVVRAWRRERAAMKLRRIRTARPTRAGESS